MVSPVPAFARHRRHVAVLDFPSAPPRRGDGPSGAAGRTLYDSEHDLFYVIAGDRVQLVAAQENLQARLRLLHILREVALAAACRRRALILQAAAIVVDGQALLVVGAGQSGKTTLMAQLLQHPGAAFMADDLVLLIAQGDGLMAVGVPSIVALRPDTPRLVPGGLSRLVNDTDTALLTPAERAARTTPTPTPDGRLLLSPRQFADALGVEQVNEAPVVGLLLPDTAGSSPVRDLSRIAAADAEPRVANAVFRIAFGGAAQSVFAAFAGGTGSYRSDLTLLHRLVQTVPAFSCSLDAVALYGHGAPPRRERRAHSRPVPS
jgi:hypothetical protein